MLLKKFKLPMLAAVLTVMLLGRHHRSAAAAGLTSGFVEKRFVTTTRVLDAPNGNPIGNAIILAGQTWFVNPMTVKTTVGNDTKEWYEVYVSSPNTVYVPATAVEGYVPPEDMDCPPVGGGG